MRSAKSGVDTLFYARDGGFDHRAEVAGVKVSQVNKARSQVWWWGGPSNGLAFIKFRRSVMGTGSPTT